jgi:hypothetical protein
MTVRSAFNRFPLDALLWLQPDSTVAGGGAPVAASAASMISLPIDFAVGYWNTDGGVDAATLLEFAVEVIVTALAATGTYTLAVQVAPDAVFTAPVVLATVQPTATGRTTLVISREAIAAALGASQTGFIRVYATLGGTTPSITYESYLSPLSGD